MDLYSIGYHHSHDRDFVIDRPNGISPSWLFLLFHGEAEVRIGRELHRVQKSSVIIYTDGTPQYYRACNDYYMDDWFHFTVDEADRKLFRELDIPLNTTGTRSTAIFIGSLPEEYSLLRGRLAQFFQAKVQMTCSPKGKGKISIQFDNEEQLERIMNALDGANG